MSPRRRLAAIAAFTLVAGAAVIAFVAHHLLGEWLSGAFQGYDAVLPLRTEVIVSVDHRTSVWWVVLGVVLATGGIGGGVMATRRARIATGAWPRGLVRATHVAELFLSAAGVLLLGPFGLFAIPAVFGWVAAIVNPAELARSRWARIYLHGCALAAALALCGLFVASLVVR